MPLRDRSSHSRRRSYSRSDSNDSYSRRRSHSRRSYSRSSSPDHKKRYGSRDSSSTSSSNHYVSDSSNSKRYNKTRTSRFEDYGNTHTSTSHYNDDKHEKKHTSTSRSRQHDSHERSSSSRFIHDKVQDTFHRPEPKQYPPSSSIALRGLVFSVTEAIAWNEIKAYGCIGCKVMSEQNTCRSKGYGFADFCTVEDAQAFMNQFPYSCDIHTKGNVLKLANSEVTLEYSDFSRKSSGKGGDWICPVCHGMNFSRRNQCFTCSNPRVKTSLDIDRLPFEFATVATNHILLSGLGSDINEEMISEVIRSFCNYIRIFIYKDINQYSRGYCLVDLESIQAASHIVTYCQTTPLKIKQYTILVGFASEKAVSDSYQPVNERSTYIPAPSLSLAPLVPVTNSFYDSQQIQQMLYNTSIASLNVASSSIGASTETPSIQANTNTISTDPLWPVHFEISCSDYIYDASSGYYFEPHSQFYYLPSKKLYLNSITGQYYIYNVDTVSFDTFTPLAPAEPYEPESFVKTEPTTSSTNIASSSVTISASSSSIHNNKSSSYNSTLAPTKKISLVFNKKSLAQTINNNESKEEEEERERKEQLKTAMELQKKQEQDSLKIKTVNLVQKKTPEKVEEVTPATTIPSSSVPPPITGVTASGKHACYICKRQFDTMDKLFKHIELSTLHQKSMEIYNKQYNVQTYRNRAEERRQDTTILPSLSISSNQNQHLQTSLNSKLTENTVQKDSIADNLLNKMGWKNQSTSTDNFDDSYFESMTHNNGKGLGY